MDRVLTQCPSLKSHHLYLYHEITVIIIATVYNSTNVCQIIQCAWRWQEAVTIASSRNRSHYKHDILVSLGVIQILTYRYRTTVKGLFFKYVRKYILFFWTNKTQRNWLFAKQQNNNKILFPGLLIEIRMKIRFLPLCWTFKCLTIAYNIQDTRKMPLNVVMAKRCKRLRILQENYFCYISYTYLKYICRLGYIL